MIKFNIGAGPTNFGPDWIHIGGGDYPHLVSPDISLDDIEENSVDIIYSSHMFEYCDREEGKRLMSKWFNKLKPGGVLRIAVPDFGAMAFLYMTGKAELKDIIGPLYGKMTMGTSKIYHKTVYDEKDLCDLLAKIGFISPHKYDYKDTEHGHIDDCSHAHLPHDPEAIASGNFTGNHTLISLNVEAIKPFK